MCTKKQVLIFLAGAEAFHSLGHLHLWLSNQTVAVAWMTLSPTWSRGSFIVNGLIAIGFLYWASKIKK